MRGVERKSGGRIKKKEKEKKKETNGRKRGRRKERKGGGVGDYEVFNFPNLGFCRRFIFFIIDKFVWSRRTRVFRICSHRFWRDESVFFKETCAYAWPTGFFFFFFLPLKIQLRCFFQEGSKWSSSPRGSAAAAASLRRRRTTGGGAAGGASGNMLQFYTNDAPGLKISPNVVLVMSIGFIAFVVILQVMGSSTLSGGRPKKSILGVGSKEHF